MGYHRPVSSFNVGKKGEHEERLHFTESAGAVLTATDLAVAGLTPLSTCDWPGQLVATVFLQGCPLACTYCHNPLLIDPRAPGTVPWADVADLLERRRGLLDGVVFSGGEPTRQHALRAAMLEVRSLGYRVGLHTAGTYPSAARAGARPRRLGGARHQVGAAALRRPDRGRRLGQGARVAAAGPARRRRGAGAHDGRPDGADARGRRRADRAAVRRWASSEHVLQEVRPDGTTTEYREALAASATLSRDRRQ